MVKNIDAEETFDLETVKYNVQNHLDELLEDLEVIRSMVFALKVDISNASDFVTVEDSLKHFYDVKLKRIELI